MLGWLFPGLRAPRAVGSRLADALIAGSADAWAEYDALYGAGRRAEALARTATLLSLDDRGDLLVEPLRRLAVLDPGSAMGWVDDLANHDAPAAIALCHRLLERSPGHVQARLTLAALLREQGDTASADEALARADRSDPDVRLLRAGTLVEAGKEREALVLLRELREEVEGHLRRTLNRDAWAYYQSVLNRVIAFEEGLVTHLEGAAGAVRHAAESGRLVFDSGINHTVVGQSAMSDSARVAVTLTLQHPETSYAQASEAATPTRDVRVRLGESALRLGRTDEAERIFRALLRDLPGFFPAHLGLGATLDARRHGWHNRAARLGVIDLDPGWAEVLPDLAVLTSEERAVVAQCVEGLSAALPGLRRAGVRVWLLPVDVRPTDRPELAELDFVRLDSRTATGVGGLASSAGVAVARIETLLDLTGTRGLTFAHEVAHVSLWHMPSDIQDAVRAAHARALRHPWSGTPYQLQNEDEFFAVAWEEWLADRCGLGAPVERDSEGVVENTMRLLDEIATLGGWRRGLS